MTPLEQLDSELDLAIKSTSNSSVIAVLGFVRRLAAEVVHASRAPDSGLAAENGKLKDTVLRLNELMNGQAAVLNALRDILRIRADQPSPQLVPLATILMQQLDSLKQELEDYKKQNVVLQDTIAALNLKLQERTLGPGTRELPPF